MRKAGCFSNVGMLDQSKENREQLLSLDRNICMNKETVIHELTHALGCYYKTLFR